LANGLGEKEEKKRLQFYNELKSDSEIAEECGVTRISILNWRLRKGLPSNYKIVKRKAEK